MSQRALKLTVQPPIGGTVRSTSEQTQPPFTSHNSVNFWPIDVMTGRAVPATRPGLTSAPTPGGTVNLLARVNGSVAMKPFQSMIANINGQIYWWDDDVWVIATGATSNDVVTTRAVFAQAFLQQVFICNDTTKPLVFDYTTGATAVLVETAGMAPSDVRIAAVWQGALWLAGEIANPHILYGSRTGDAYDWDYSVPLDDTGGAFATTGENEGLLTGPITALIPQTSDTMIVSTIEGLIAMRAHPRRGGIFDPFGPAKYVLGQGAWCKGPDGTIYMITNAGFETLSPEVGAVPVLISDKLLPDELKGLDYVYEDPVINMEYDTRWNGVIITVRGEQQQAWLYDLKNGGFHAMNFAEGYPFVLMEFPPFSQLNSSGVLFGGVGYGGLAFFDRGSTEVFESTITVGPIPISDSVMTKNMISKGRFIFGRDSPKDDDTTQSILMLAVGTDGQDAINKLAIGEIDYTANLKQIKANSGIALPRVSGCYLAFVIDQIGGQFSFEGLELKLEPKGDNNVQRSEQLSVAFDPTDFGADSDFNEDDWNGYIENAPIDPICTPLTDWTHWLDLSILPVAWWAKVQFDGRDIRCTNNANDSIPIDLVHFNKTNKTGFLAIKLTQTIPARPIRVWVGNDTVGAPAKTDTYGQYNAYDSNWKAFWPDGADLDRTINVNHLTMANVGVAYLGTGTIGVQSTDYRANGNTTTASGSTTVSVPTPHPLTLIAVTQQNAPDQTVYTSLMLHGNVSNFASLQTRRLSGDLAHSRSQATTASSTGGAGGGTAISATVVYDTNFRHQVARFASATSRQALMDGAFSGTDTANGTPNATATLVVGNNAFGIGGSVFLGRIELAQVHNTSRNDCWVDYQNKMLNQSTFWGDWGDFHEINPTPGPAEPDDVACPLGIIDVVETGTWTGYARAVPDAPTGSNLPDWTHWINLAPMPASWWTAVTSTGKDIRATNDDNVFIPLDLIEFNKIANTGFAVVKLSQNTTTPQAVRLWVGNTTAVIVDPCAAYGQYAAYDEHYKGFWPTGAGNDRTQNLNHLTASGSFSAGGVTGPIGNTGTFYPEHTFSYKQRNAGLMNVNPALLSFVYKVNSLTDLSTPTALLTNSSTITSFGTLRSYHNVGHNQYFSYTSDLTKNISIHDLRNIATGQSTASRSAYLQTAHDVTDWTLIDDKIYSASAAAPLNNDSVVDSTGAGSFVAGTFKNIIIHPDLTSFGVNHGPCNFSLISLHDFSYGILGTGTTEELAARNTWHSYRYAMLNQTTFWNGWTWVASSSTLPQP